MQKRYDMIVEDEQEMEVLGVIDKPQTELLNKRLSKRETVAGPAGKDLQNGIEKGPRISFKAALEMEQPDLDLEFLDEVNYNCEVDMQLLHGVVNVDNARFSIHEFVGAPNPNLETC